MNKISALKKEIETDAFFDWKNGMPIKADCKDCTTKDYWPYGCFFCENKLWSVEDQDVVGCTLGHPTILATVARLKNPHVKRSRYLVMYRTPAPEEILKDD